MLIQIVTCNSDDAVLFAYRFNRGSLVNVGFILTEFTFDYIAIHDVDLIPENQNITYSYPELGPYHVSAPGLHPKYNYKKFLGGILLITKEHFRAVSMLTKIVVCVCITSIFFFAKQTCIHVGLCFVLTLNCCVWFFSNLLLLWTCFL